jgi:hypothetical protein
MAEPLSVASQESAGLAIFNLISKYPELPFKADAKNIQWQSISKDVGIGVFVTQGAYYIKKYVSGSYIGLAPLRIVYNSNPTSNKGRKGVDTFLNDLANWLESCSIAFEDNHLELESIVRTSPVFKSEADANGYEQYSCTINVKFFYRR